MKELADKILYFFQSHPSGVAPAEAVTEISKMIVEAGITSQAEYFEVLSCCVGYQVHGENSIKALLELASRPVQQASLDIWS